MFIIWPKSYKHYVDDKSSTLNLPRFCKHVLK